MPPDAIGRYELRGELGHGGHASVYRAYDPRFGREVAVKVLRRELLADAQFRSRFEREARAIASLEHAAIVPVHDFGEHDGQPYLVMRLMRGDSLDHRLAQGRLATQDEARILERIASALDAAHDAGITHRDVKPGNILLDDQGNAYLTDFGIARLMEASTMLTQAGVSLGTPAYMSPEQTRGEALTPASDVYSLGVVAFEMVCGRVPFLGHDPVAMALQHREDPVPAPRTLNPGLSETAETSILKALNKQQTDRFATTSAFALSFSGAVEAQPALLETELTEDAEPTQSVAKPSEAVGATPLESTLEEAPSEASTERAAPPEPAFEIIGAKESVAVERSRAPERALAEASLETAPGPTSDLPASAQTRVEGRDGARPVLAEGPAACREVRPLEVMVADGVLAQWVRRRYRGAAGCSLESRRPR